MLPEVVALVALIAISAGWIAAEIRAMALHRRLTRLAAVVGEMRAHHAEHARLAAGYVQASTHSAAPADQLRLAASDGRFQTASDTALDIIG